MRRYLLDTGAASDHLNHRLGVHLRAHAAVSNGDRVGVCMPVVAELFAGVECSATRDRNLWRLRRFLATITIWPFDRGAAEAYGRIYAALRRSGRPMQQADIQIAAIALSLGNCTVVSKDTDFAAVPGLAVEDWSRE